MLGVRQTVNNRIKGAGGAIEAVNNTSNGAGGGGQRGC